MVSAAAEAHDLPGHCCGSQGQCKTKVQSTHSRRTEISHCSPAHRLSSRELCFPSTDTKPRHTELLGDKVHSLPTGQCQAPSYCFPRNSFYSTLAVWQVVQLDKGLLLWNKRKHEKLHHSINLSIDALTSLSTHATSAPHAWASTGVNLSEQLLLVTEGSFPRLPGGTWGAGSAGTQGARGSIEAHTGHTHCGQMP